MTDLQIELQRRFKTWVEAAPKYKLCRYKVMAGGPGYVSYTGCDYNDPKCIWCHTRYVDKCPDNCATFELSETSRLYDRFYSEYCTAALPLCDMCNNCEVMDGAQSTSYICYAKETVTAGDTHCPNFKYKS